jgi:hypothetical protein
MARKLTLHAPLSFFALLKVIKLVVESEADQERMAADLGQRTYAVWVVVMGHGVAAVDAAAAAGS